MTATDHSKEAVKIINECVEKARKIETHSVVLLWISPFGNLDHRVGYFEDYDDAARYAYDIYTACKKANGDDAVCEIYIDGSTSLQYVK